MENITNFDKLWIEAMESLKPNENIILNITIIAIMGMITIVGVIGNVATCIVILRYRSMRTVTNLYLLNLAASDLILLIILVPNNLLLWKATPNYPLGNIGCKLHIFVTVLLLNNGILTILALTIERYFAICHPLFSKAQPKSRVFKIIIFIWVFSIVISSINSFDVALKTINKVTFCTFIPSTSMRVTNGVVAIFMFAIPMIIIIVVFVMIAVRINRKDKSKNKSFNRNSSGRKATWMLGAMTLAFFVCWSPHFVMRTLTFMSNTSNFIAIFKKIGNGLSYVWFVNTWLSTAINPIIFTLMSDQFRTAFKTLLKRRGHKEETKNRQIIIESTANGNGPSEIRNYDQLSKISD